MVHLSGSVRVSFAAIYQRRCLQLKKQKFKKQSKEAEILKQREKVQKQRERIKFSEFLRGKGKKVYHFPSALYRISRMLTILVQRSPISQEFWKICWSSAEMFLEILRKSVFKSGPFKGSIWQGPPPAPRLPLSVRRMGAAHGSESQDSKNAPAGRRTPTEPRTGIAFTMRETTDGKTKNPCVSRRLNDREEESKKEDLWKCVLTSWYSLPEVDITKNW